ncbi:hypothetical protein [Paraburkholderia franconis]|uniref:hypothetical protein n=1 Tax=Paraburkholderia franconis TaxID=2654983 RepID=UPI00187B8688|nr:hypothetical protein [Paraburkholderia franconis]
MGGTTARDEIFREINARRATGEFPRRATSACKNNWRNMGKMRGARRRQPRQAGANPSPSEWHNACVMFPRCLEKEVER